MISVSGYIMCSDCVIESHSPSLVQLVAFYPPTLQRKNNVGAIVVADLALTRWSLGLGWLIYQYLHALGARPIILIHSGKTMIHVMLFRVLQIARPHTAQSMFAARLSEGRTCAREWSSLKLHASALDLYHR